MRPTLFDILDKDRHIIQGIWETKEVWMDGVKLISPDNGRFVFKWGDVNNLTIHGQDALITAIVRYIDCTKHGDPYPGSDNNGFTINHHLLPWLIRVFERIQRDDFTLLINARDQKVITYEANYI